MSALTAARCASAITTIPNGACANACKIYPRTYFEDFEKLSFTTITEISKIPQYYTCNGTIMVVAISAL